jgi:hypothetical protein
MPELAGKGRPSTASNEARATVLGPLLCSFSDNPSGKSTEVLIRLALDAGVIVRAERLIEDLWGAEADATARNTRCRPGSRCCGAHSATLQWCPAGAGGHTLEVDPSTVDAPLPSS